MAVVLITGAANGIGRALAELYAADGDTIAALDRDAVGLASLAAGIPRCETAIADVTDAAQLLTAVQSLEHRLGPIDVLIASAGIGIETSGRRFDAGDFKRVIDVNLIGVANSIAAVIPGMTERKRGHIVALSSLASYTGIPRLLAYCASKSGVNALCDGLRPEVAPLGIRVTTICPGWIETAMTAPVKHSLPDIMPLDFAAKRIYSAIRQERTFLAFPRSMAWQLRFINCLPRSWRDRILVKMAKRTRSAGQ